MGNDVRYQLIAPVDGLAELSEADDNFSGRLMTFGGEGPWVNINLSNGLSCHYGAGGHHSKNFRATALVMQLTGIQIDTFGPVMFKGLNELDITPMLDVLRGDVAASAATSPGGTSWPV